VKEKRELITEGTFVLLDAEVFTNQHVAPLDHQAVFVLRAEKPVGHRVTREQMLAWTLELAGRMYAEDYE